MKCKNVRVISSLKHQKTNLINNYLNTELEITRDNAIDIIHNLFGTSFNADQYPNNVLQKIIDNLYERGIFNLNVKIKNEYYAY